MKKAFSLLFVLWFLCQPAISNSSAAAPPAGTPTVLTLSATNISAVAARGRGRITAVNSGNASNRGVIYYLYSDSDKLIGDAGVTNESENGNFTTGIYVLPFTGLSVNTRYNTRAHATNTAGIAYGTRMDFWTDAKAPLAPVLTNPTTTSLSLAITENNNPAITEFCIAETGGQFVQEDGSLGATAFWQTKALWGTKVITGLTEGTTYTFQVKARNGALLETAFGATASGIAGTIIYVDEDATTGANNGSSWADAFVSLETALATALSPQQIWVSEGTYYPSNETGGTGSRYQTFQLQPGVSVYGGFSGIETLLSQRNFSTNVTMLSGDIGTTGDSTDNCYHVFFHPLTLTPALDANAVLDGFTISGGNANAATLPHNSGGGIYNWGHSPTISNCIFTHNYAYLGGAMRIREALPTISDCSFLLNRADDGGAVFNSSGSNATFLNCSFTSNMGESGGGVQNNSSDATFTSCTFSSNTATNYGGAVQNQGTGNPVFTNCNFHSNSAGIGGGAIFNDSASIANYVNCLVYNNSAVTFGAGVLNHSCTATMTNMTIVNNDSYYGGGVTNDSSTVTIQNSIVWGNTGTIATQIANNGSTVSILYSNIPMGASDTASNPSNPGTLNLLNNIVTYPKFFDPGNDDYTLYGNSPCVNSGNNAYNVSAEDLRGKTRIQNSTIDRGAYEWTNGTDSASTHLIVYADAAKPDDSGDGFSWANAKKTLQAAVDLVSNDDKVWVKAGSYLPTSYHGLAPGSPANNRLMHFRMKPAVSIYGGLNGTELPDYNLSLRDFITNETILSGDINTTGDSTDNCYHVFYHPSGLSLSATSMLNGFSISGGNANGTGIHASGGGLHNNTNNPLVRNCTFERNHAAEKGGAVYTQNGNIAFISCNFVENGANEAGCMYLQSSNNVSLKYCQISNNVAVTSAGGFLLNTGSVLTVVNSLINGNTSADYGGGIYIHFGANATFTNCTFSKNHASYGGGAYTNGNGLVFNNSILWGNTSSQWGNQIETTAGTGTVLNNSCFANVYDFGQGIYDVEGSVSATACISINPGFVDASDNNFLLKGNSPCVNTGQNTYNTEPFDLRWEDRIQDTTIDMGAYEWTTGLDPDYTNLFVKADASGSNNGTDWTNAYISLQSALDQPLISGDKIWVAKGVYHPSKDYGIDGENSRSHHFRLIPGVVMNGGLAGSEDVAVFDLSTRDFSANETILSGDQGNNADTSDNCFHVFYHPDGLGLTTNAVIDGFTMTKGNATGENDHARGAAMFNRNNSPTLRHCKITENYALNDGGGIYNDNSSPAITNCFMAYDSCRYSGGAIYNHEGSNPVISNCVIAGNSAIYGGAIFNQNSSAAINTSTIAGNKSYQGGAIFAEGDLASTVTINNSIFWGNTGWSLEGQQMYVKGSATVEINYSCYPDDVSDISGSGGFLSDFCLHTYPGFADPLIGDFHLVSSSPCVDKGLNSANILPFDIRGEDRVQNSIIDMGAYEYTDGIDPQEDVAVSGSLAKDPDQAIVCGGNNVSATLTAGTGGNGTDNTKVRTNDGTGWSAWIEYTSTDPISTSDITAVEIRTYRESDYGLDGTADTVRWTIDPATEGGAVTGDTAVCPGTNSTLLTLSGHEGSVEKWQYSTDGNNWNDLTSHTSTTYTAVNLTQDTWYRAVVQSGICSPVNSDSLKISVLTNFKISGYAKYNNNPQTPLNGLKIILNENTTAVDSVITTGTGYYEFSGLSAGEFNLTVKSAHSSGQWQTWGGVNNTDYLLVTKHIANSLLLPVNPPVVRVTASVKIPHPAINLADATAIRQAAKYPSTGWNYFDIPKWVFSGTDATTRIDTIDLACSNITRNIFGLCAGDVNGTYVPVSGFKMAAPTLELVNNGTLPIERNIVFPVRAEHAMELGAITLLLDYDKDLIEITGIEMADNGGVEPWFEVQGSKFKVGETPNLEPGTLNILHIGWMSLNPISVEAGQTVLMIHARVNNDVVETGLKPVFTGASNIRFTLNANPLSELADGDGNVIDNAKLTIPDANENGEMVRWRDGEIGLLSVFPNPAKDVLNVEFVVYDEVKTQNLVSLQLLNMHGVVVVSMSVADAKPGLNNARLDVSNLPNGVYMLNASVGSAKKTIKVVINR